MLSNMPILMVSTSDISNHTCVITTIILIKIELLFDHKEHQEKPTLLQDLLPGCCHWGGGRRKGSRGSRTRTAACRSSSLKRNSLQNKFMELIKVKVNEQK